MNGTDEVPIASRPLKRELGSRALRASLGTPLTTWQVVFFLVPVMLMCAMTFWRVSDYRLVPAMTWDNWSATLHSVIFWGALWRTLFFAVVTGLVGVVLAVPFAYGIARALPTRLVQLALAGLILPFFTSYLARVFSWQFMLSDHGVLSIGLQKIGLDVTLLGSPLSLVIGYLTYSFPLAAVIIFLAFLNADRRLEEAAQNLGYGRWSTFTKVVLPGSRPSIIAAGAFITILAFGDVITPQVLGGGQHMMLGTLVVDSVKGGVNFPQAATIGVAMVITIMAIVALTLRLAFGSGRQR